jgi:hypothetical protein
VVFVLDLGLREGRPAVDAPVDRLLALVDHALLDERSQSPDDGGLIREVHRQVGVRPVAEHAQPLEARPLEVDEPFGVGPARATEFGHAHLALLRTQLAIDLQLDRQTVTVPARHVRRVVPRHGLGFDHEVLEHLVECGAKVNATVGVRRPIVKDELPCAMA